MPSRDTILLSLGLVATGSSIVLFYFAANVTFQKGGFPLGFDTSYYLAYVKTIQLQGVSGFVHGINYYNVLYPIVESLPTLLGVSSLTMEIFFPVLISVLVLIASCYLVLSSGDRLVGLLSIAFVSGWFALYRMGADYHANLLAMPFLLCSTALLLRVERDSRLTKSRFTAFAVSTAFASTAHIETTIFFVVLWLIAAVYWSFRTESKSQRSVLAMAATGVFVSLPLGIIWLAGAINLVRVTGGVTAVYQPSPSFWLVVLGPSALLCLLGLAVCIFRLSRHRDTAFESILTFWSILSLALGLLAYITPAFPISFSDRAFLLLPVPFLAGVGTTFVVRKLSVDNHVNPVKIAALLIVVPVLLAPMVYSYTAPRYYKEYIDSATYNEMTWLANNFKPSSTPVFLFNFPAGCAGDLGLLFSNWVSATFGEHYTYLGTIGNLTAGRQTNYTNAQSQIVSSLLFEEMKSAGVVEPALLHDHPVVMFRSLYNGYVDSTKFTLTNLTNGIYVITQIQGSNNVSSTAITNATPGNQSVDSIVQRTCGG